MSIRTARIIFLLSLLLLAFVVLDFLTLRSKSDKEEANRNTNFAQLLQGNVLTATVQNYHYKFHLKEAVLGAVLPGTTNESYINGATAEVVNKASFHCGDSGSDYFFTDTGSFYMISCQEAASMQVIISKSGYQTKTVSISHYQGEIPTVYLSKYVPPPPETIKDITLPAVFHEAGSQTTDLKKISDTTKVEGLILDTKKATLKFKEPVNLSSKEVKEKFKKLDEYVRLGTTAIVDLNSSSLPELNKKASVTMKGLPWIATPRVLVNGKEDKSIVSNIKYAKGTLTFDVTHFSVFKAAPSVSVTEPSNNFEVHDKQITLKGVVSDPTASVSAKLNNRNLGKIKVSTVSGQFETKLDLVEGLNYIVVNALSLNGATASATISGTLVFVTSNFYFYSLLGLLALLAIGAAGFSCYKMRKNRIVTVPPEPLKQ